MSEWLVESYLNNERSVRVRNEVLPDSAEHSTAAKNHYYMIRQHVNRNQEVLDIFRRRKLLGHVCRMPNNLLANKGCSVLWKMFGEEEDSQSDGLTTLYSEVGWDAVIRRKIESTATDFNRHPRSLTTRKQKN